MGDITLGCLLGQYDGSLSFDVASKASPLTPGEVGSWTLETSVAAFDLVGRTSYVHSSAQALQVRVGCHGVSQSVLQYDFQQADDAFARWFPDVATHAVRIDFWNSITYGPLVRFYQDWGVLPQVLLDANAKRNETLVASGDGRLLRFATLATSTMNAVVLDDMVLQTDAITLHPTFDAQWQQHVIRSQARTQGGQLYATLWGQYFAYSLPLQFLPDSCAAVINWWWQNQLNLALTLDTSDTASLRLVRIVNDTQPIGKRMAPYADEWQGVLQLESLDAGSLVF